MIIHLKDTPRFERAGFYGRVFVPSEAQKGFNALLITVDGRHPVKRMVGTTRLYFVLDGTGSFMVDRAKHKVIQHDLIVIDPGHEYSYEGKMTLFEVNVSDTNSFKDELLE